MDPKENETENNSAIERSDRSSHNSASTKESKIESSSSSSSSPNTPHLIPTVSSNESCTTESKTSFEESATVKLGPEIRNDDDKKECDAKVKGSETVDNGDNNLSGLRSSESFSGLSSENNYVATKETEKQPRDQDKAFSFGHESSSRDTKSKGDRCEIDLNEDAAIDHDVGPVLSKPKPLMAKPGTPLLFPISRSQNNGSLCNRKGFTTNGNSAFRPTLTSSKDSIEANNKTIDLNLDASEIESVRDGPEKATRLDFDLNCAGESDENCRDFDLNDELAPSESLRPVDSSNFRSVPGLVQTQFQPFLISPPPNIVPPGDPWQRISYFQPQFAYDPSSQQHFRVDPRSGFSSAGPTHGAFPAFPGHVFQVPRGPARLDVEAYGGANPGRLGAPLTGSGGAAPAGMKRREPEGGWDSRQHCVRQMNYWH